MLPTHRPSSGEKRVNPLSRPILRFLVLGCCMLAGLWIIGPLFADFLWGPPGPPPELDYYYDQDLPPHRPTPLEDHTIWRIRRDQVREAFKHAWAGYRSIAYPADELFPVSGGKSNKYVLMFCGSSSEPIYIPGIMDGE